MRPARQERLRQSATMVFHGMAWSVSARIVTRRQDIPSSWVRAIRHARRDARRAHRGFHDGP